VGAGGNLLTADQPPQSPEGWERWFLQVIKMATTADYLAVHGQPAAGNETRTHLIHATCRRRQTARLLGGPGLGEMTAVAGVGVQPADRLGWHETGGDHAPLGDLC
jgi:hypothetical protein